MTDLSIGEQRARAGLSSTGTHTIRRGPPKDGDQVRVDGELYKTVGDEERVDLPPDELEARKTAFDDARRARHQQIKATRASMPLWMRLEEVGNAMARFQAPRAREIQSAPGRGSNDDAVLPPGGDDRALAHFHPQEVERRTQDIEKAIERLEEMLDAHRGLAPAREYALMDSYDKNKIILEEFVGFRPEEVAAFEPSLGTARTIRYVRRLHGQKPQDGTPDPEAP